MQSPRVRFTSVDEYIASFPEATQKRMQELRSIIRSAAPNVEEKISYQMAGFKLNGSLIYFAGNKNHIGVYAAGSARAAFPELAAYAGPKGALRFPHAEPFPLGLLKKVVKFRVAENLERAGMKTTKSKQ